MNLFNYKAYLNLSSGEKIPAKDAVSEKKVGGAIAVSVRAKCRDSSFKECSNGSLDADRGVSLAVEVMPEVCGIMADYRRGEYWCSPYFPKDFSDVPDETQVMVFRLADGDFVAVVPLVNESYKCVLHAGDKKSFGARVFSWCENLYSCEGDVMVYAKASRPSDAIHACVEAAVKLLDGKVRKREERRYPEILEYLGWCSWDSMQIRVCEEGILQKRDEFSEKGIPVRWMMLDDMWAYIKDFWGRTYADFKEMIAVM